MALKEERYGQIVVKTTTIHPYTNPPLYFVVAFKPTRLAPPTLLELRFIQPFLVNSYITFLAPICSKCASHYIKQIIVKVDKPAQAQSLKDFNDTAVTG